MKRLNYIFITMIAVLLLSSCGEDESLTKKIEGGTNLIGFTDVEQGYSGIADGTEYPIEVKMRIVGPSMAMTSGDYDAVIEVDASSTAIEGTHFRIDNPNITLKASEDYIGKITVTMLTDGIQTPLDESPVVVLKVKSVGGEASVIPNGKTLPLTLNYACPSFLEGDYLLEVTSSTGGYYTAEETIVKTGVGEYLTPSVGTWSSPLNAPNGLIFKDVCGVITVPNQDLAAMYSNATYGHKVGSVNSETGVITIYYTIEFSAGNREYTAVYTPLK
nr:hypothetical protein [uncultured Carboxylicivirga sp.]